MAAPSLLSTLHMWLPHPHPTLTLNISDPCAEKGRFLNALKGRREEGKERARYQSFFSLLLDSRHAQMRVHTFPFNQMAPLGPVSQVPPILMCLFIRVIPLASASVWSTSGGEQSGACVASPQEGS